MPSEKLEKAGNNSLEWLGRMPRKSSEFLMRSGKMLGKSLKILSMYVSQTYLAVFGGDT